MVDQKTPVQLRAVPLSVRAVISNAENLNQQWSARLGPAGTYFSVVEEMKNTWQPIESAPKDDEEVLLYFANGDMEIADWREDAQMWDGLSGWIRATPTHWMPLPDPPES